MTHHIAAWPWNMVVEVVQSLWVHAGWFRFESNALIIQQTKKDLIWEKNGRDGLLHFLVALYRTFVWMEFEMHSIS